MDSSRFLTEDKLDRIIRSGSGDVALLFLHILKSGRFSLSAAARDTGMSRERVSAAASILKGLGVALQEEHLESETLPEYSPADIVVRAQRDASFEGLVEETQHKLGKLLSTADMKILFGIYDHLGMPAEVIMLLLNHCIEDIRERYGPGRMPTMRQIEKEAWFWAEQEICTYEVAEEHIRREAERKSLVFRIAQLLQIKGRELTPGERRYIDSWLDMGFGPDEMAVAYDRTILGTGKLAWKYMNKILCSWHEKGLHTVEAIRSGDSRGRGKAEDMPSAERGAKNDAQTPTAEDDSELEELRRLHAYLKNREK